MNNYSCFSCCNCNFSIHWLHILILFVSISCIYLFDIINFRENIDINNHVLNQKNNNQEHANAYITKDYDDKNKNMQINNDDKNKNMEINNTTKTKNDTLFQNIFKSPMFKNYDVNFITSLLNKNIKDTDTDKED